MGFLEKMRRPAGDTMLSRAVAAHPEIMTACALAFAFAASAACMCYWDNDIHYIISLGRSILSDGIPRTDPLTCNEGLSCVAQQWLFCAGAAALYDSFGKNGVCIAVGSLWSIAALAVLACAKAFSKESSRRASAAVAACLLCIFPFIKTNPRALDVICLAACMLAVERFLAGARPRLLAAPIAASAAMANLHCSMWVLAAAPVFCALVDERAGGRRREIACALALTCAASAASPYGLDGTLFIFRSLAAPGLHEFHVAELQAMTFTLKTAFFSLPLAAAIAAYIASVARAGRSFEVRAIDVMFAGFALLALSQIRNCLLFAPVAAWALLYRMPARAKRKKEKTAGARLAQTAVCMVLAICLPVLAAARAGSDEESASFAEEAQKAGVVAALLDAGIEPGDAVGNVFGTGGWLEEAGFRPLVDERAELLCPEVNGGSDLIGQQTEIADKKPSAIEGMLLDGRWRAVVVPAELAEAFKRIGDETGYSEAFGCELYTVLVRQSES